MGTVQVAVGQAVTLAHEGQCLGRVQVLVASREVGAGVDVAYGVVQADFHPAEYLGELVEAVEIHRREVVNMDTCELFDGRDGRSLACLVAKCPRLSWLMPEFCPVSCSSR